MLVVVGFVAAAVIVLLYDTKPWENRLGGAAFFLLGAASTYVIGLRSGVELDASSVRVRTLIGPTICFPLSDLDHASGGMVLNLHRRSGQVVAVRAVANTNITLLLRRGGRTERVASEINAYLEDHRRSG